MIRLLPNGLDGFPDRVDRLIRRVEQGRGVALAATVHRLGVTDLQSAS
ncbi:MAG TPA: hypothetical protein VG053_12240 [Solirubrobacteraceae bacterium]|nr:hypothetical protein [Solirubrobacteraceae bacterium]